MDYRNWYCVMVASGCEAKARADLMARKGVVGDRFITEVAVPETTELTFDKKGNRKAVKSKLLPRLYPGAGAEGVYRARRRNC